MKKSPQEIKEKMWFWYFKRKLDRALEYTGREPFTLYELISEKTREWLAHTATFQAEEIPVFSLKVAPREYIISSTHRFIRINQGLVETLDYQDFAGHIGFRTNMMPADLNSSSSSSNIAFRQPDGKLISVKTEGYIQHFGLQTRSGEIILWPVPTGNPGFNFWNATLKCHVIGSEYLTDQV